MLSGECSLNFSIVGMSFVEPFLIAAAIEQMSDELAMSLTAPDAINANDTGTMLSDFAEMEFDFFCENQAISTKTKHDVDSTPFTSLNENVSEVRNYVVVNESRLGFLIFPKRNDDATDPNSSPVMNGLKLCLIDNV